MFNSSDKQSFLPKINQIYKNNLYKRKFETSLNIQNGGMLKYSVVHNFLNSPPIMIKFVKFFSFKHYMLRFAFPFNITNIRKHCALQILNSANNSMRKSGKEIKNKQK